MEKDLGNAYYGIAHAGICPYLIWLIEEE